MIGNYSYWLNVRLDSDGQVAGTLHASAQYTDQRSASISTPISDEALQALAPQLKELLASSKDQLQLKATLAAAEALGVAAKSGEIGGINE